MKVSAVNSGAKHALRFSQALVRSAEDEPELDGQRLAYLKMLLDDVQSTWQRPLGTFLETRHSMFYSASGFVVRAAQELEKASLALPGEFPGEEKEEADTRPVDELLGKRKRSFSSSTLEEPFVADRGHQKNHGIAVGRTNKRKYGDHIRA